MFQLNHLSPIPHRIHTQTHLCRSENAWIRRERCTYINSSPHIPIWTITQFHTSVLCKHPGADWKNPRAVIPDSKAARGEFVSGRWESEMEWMVSKVVNWFGHANTHMTTWHWCQPEWMREIHQIVAWDIGWWILNFTFTITVQWNMELPTKYYWESWERYCVIIITFRHTMWWKREKSIFAFWWRLFTLDNKLAHLPCASADRKDTISLHVLE